MNSFRSLVYSSTELNATGLVCRDSGFVQVAFWESDSQHGILAHFPRIPFFDHDIASRADNGPNSDKG